MLLHFSKILEQIMHNCFYQYLTKNIILYSEQTGFQMAFPTEHAIVQLVNQILESFEDNKYNLDVLSTYLLAIQSII